MCRHDIFGPDCTPDRDRGEANRGVLFGAMALLAVAALLAGLGWAGVFDGDDSVTTRSEWPATLVGDAELHRCAATAVVDQMAEGDSITVVGRAAGNSWLAIRDPDGGGNSLWLPAASVASDDLPVWGSLPLLDCTPAEGADSFTGTVRDSVTGAPLAGVSVTPTDVAGTPLDETMVVSTEDGTYTITGLTSDEYGIWVDGTALGHEQGYTGAEVGPYGYLVVAHWGQGATAAPGVIGDIAIDPLGADGTTTTSSTDATSTTTPVTAPATTPGTTLPAGQQPPTIVSLTATPSAIVTTAGCGSQVALLTAVVTDDEEVASVVVKVAYNIAAAGTSVGVSVNLAMVQVDDTTWQAPLHLSLPPYDPPQYMQLKVTATDHDNLVWWRNFNHILRVSVC